MDAFELLYDFVHVRVFTYILFLTFIPCRSFRSASDNLLSVTRL